MTAATHHGVMRRASLVAMALALQATGCGPVNVGALPTSPPPAALRVHAVVGGDTLTGIAERECGDRAAALSIFEASRGRLQGDGGALVDPDRLAVGWELVLDCSVAGAAATFVPAPIDAGPPPADPGGPLDVRSVPERTIRLRPADTPGDGVGDCQGQGPLPATVPWVVRAGAVAAGIQLGHGASRFVQLQDFGGDVQVDLVAGSGRRMSLEGSDIGFELYADPQLAPGRYVVEARSGDLSGTGTVEITAASRPELVLRTTGPRRYDIVGGAATIALVVYRWAPGACDEDPQLWQEAGDLGLSDGVGRLTVTTAGAAPGTYCIAVRDGPTPADDCRDRTRLLRV